MLRLAWAALEDFLWPRPCPICGSRFETICEHCSLPWPRSTESEDLAVPLPPLTVVRSAFRYDEPVRSLLVRVKYGGEPDLLAALLHVAQSRIPELHELHFPDAVVPVPTSSARLRRRGFDPALLVARAVGETLDLPLLNRALRRTVQGPAQTTLTRSERLVNLVGAFDCEGVLCRSVLLVDDVVTTGGTLLACAQALHQAGARRVSAFTLARTPPGR